MTPKKILIAFDESENAMRAVQFVAQTFSPEAKVTLFSVVVDTAALCNMQSPELVPYFKSQQRAFCELEDKKKDLVQAAAQNAVAVLETAGFSKDNLLIRLKPKESGIARDIIRESENNYDLVVLGRRGLSGIREFILGSTSQKVMQGVQKASILVVN